MFQTFMACTDGLVDILEKTSKLQDAADIKDIAARYTIDIIGSCGFGINCNSLREPDSEFRKQGRRLFEMTTFEKIKNTIFFMFSKRILDVLKFKQIPQSLEDFFINTIKNTIEYRETKNVSRKDFIQMLMEIKNKGYISEDNQDNQVDVKDKTLQNPLTMNEMAAQCFVFFIAGFETSATTMAFALLELALNQAIQDKLRKEINDVLKKYNGEISYDAVMEMAYLDKVVYGKFLNTIYTIEIRLSKTFITKYLFLVLGLLLNITSYCIF